MVDKVALKHLELEAKENSGIWNYSSFPFPNGNYNGFYFTHNSIVFIYSEEEIACTNAGAIRIKVPLSEIKQYLKPEIRKLLNK